MRIILIKKLKSLRDRDVITEEEFRDKKVKLFIEQLKNKQLPNRGALIRILKNAHKDKSAFSYWFDPIIYSSDPAIQLFVKSVKQAVMKSNDMTLDFKYDLEEEYDELLKQIPKEANWEELTKYESQDYTVASQELACAAGGCEII